jgi:hypothetical protein
MKADCCHEQAFAPPTDCPVAGEICQSWHQRKPTHPHPTTDKGEPARKDRDNKAIYSDSPIHLYLNEVEVAHCPARPLFTRTLTSTRRFSARPFAVSLDAAGSAVPIAPGAITCRTGTLQSWIKYPMQERAGKRTEYQNEQPPEQPPLFPAPKCTGGDREEQLTLNLIHSRRT